MSEWVRFGIAGFGRHAVKRLMPGFAASQRCTVTALSRRDPSAAEASAHEHGVAHAFASTEELCRSDDVDAVFVASPDAIHLSDVLTALRHGKHVLCEKPMGMNAGECRQMVEAAQRMDRLLGVAHVLRFAHSVRRAQALVAQGALGGIAQARAEFHYWNEGHGRLWINDPTLACGGPMGDVGIHCIDSLRFILQDEVTHVTTVARSDERSHPLESSALMTLEFCRGVLAEVAVSTRAHYRTPFAVVGSQAVLEVADGFNLDAPVQLQLRQTPSGKASAEEISNRDAFQLQADAFAAAVAGEADFPCSGEDGWKNQLVLDAAYRSWRSGKRESVAPIR